MIIYHKCSKIINVISDDTIHVISNKYNNNIISLGIIDNDKLIPIIMYALYIIVCGRM